MRKREGRISFISQIPNNLCCLAHLHILCTFSVGQVHYPVSKSSHLELAGAVRHRRGRKQRCNYSGRCESTKAWTYVCITTNIRCNMLPSGLPRQIPGTANYAMWPKICGQHIITPICDCWTLFWKARHKSCSYPDRHVVVSQIRSTCMYWNIFYSTAFSVFNTFSYL